MPKKSTVKTSLFTLILAFVVAGTVTIKAATQNNSSSKEIEDKDSKSKATESKRATTLLFFQGNNPNDPAQVANPALWTEDDNSQPCDTGDDKACSMEVDSDDVTPNSLGKLQLNPAEITLQALSTGAGYVPAKDPSSNSSHPITPFNRD